MMLNGGELDGVRAVQPAHRRRSSPSRRRPPDQPILRGLGWDIDSPYSGNRGELFPIGSYGHTGFTGTSIWIDPSTKTYVILLANSVHPDCASGADAAARQGGDHRGRGGGNRACRACTLTGYNETLSRRGRAPRSGAQRRDAHRPRCAGGAEVPAAGRQARRPDHQPDRRRPRRAAATSTSCARRASTWRRSSRRSTAFAGKEDRPGIQDATDPATGIKIFSLYGNTMRPTPEMLRGLDALVFDIQDVGARFYTYETTMAYAHGSGGQGRHSVLRAGPAQPHHRDARGRAAAGCRQPVRSSAISPACRCGTA